MSQFYKYIFTLCFLTGSCLAQGGECPHGWTKLKDEKCYLLVSTYSNYANAKQTCADNGGYLALVKEQDEQNFLTNFLFNTSQVELGVWIGATRETGSQFRWEDGSNVEYSNWDVDCPSSVDGRDCVAMQSRLSKIASEEDGKWKDVSCNSANFLVCETVPSWSSDDIKRVLIETRKSLEDTKYKLDDTINKLEATREELADEKRNPVPAGFIYIEYYGQTAPQTLWPAVNWTDVTSTYAGLFFRALGGGSAEFGTTQGGDAPTLTQVGTQQDGDRNFRTINITPGSWSSLISTGTQIHTGSMQYGMKFHVTNSEVRPKNVAIRIWKREA